MEEFEESIIVETANDGRIHHDQPEEVVIILPDESCFEYEGSKKVRHDGGNKVTWTKEQTHMLIDEYKNNREELENPTTGTKSAVWEKIAEKFNEKWSSNFSADMCASKWRSMKNTYKRVRYSQRPDHSKKRWEYYEALSDVYKNVKLTKPNSRMLSGAASEQQAVHIVQFAPQSSSSAGRSYSPIRLCPEPTSFNYDSEPPSWFREFIQEYHKSEDVKLKMLQQIHKDIVRIGERQCVALEKLAEELKN